jgi:tetratricopeptide (TPR) repeat protein
MNTDGTKRFMSRVRLGLLCSSIAVSVAPAQAAESLQQVLDRAAQRFEQQDYKRARSAYEQATRIDPGSIVAWRGLGWTLWQLGDRIRAFEVWSDIAKVRPNEAEIILALAQAHEFLDNWHEAVDYYGRFLEQRPYERPALMGRARIYQRLGQFEAAEQDLRTLIARHPADFDATFMLAQICQSTGRPAEAAILFDELAQRGPEPRLPGLICRFCR